MAQVHHQKLPKNQSMTESAQVAAPLAAQAPAPLPADSGEGLEAPERVVAAQLAAAAEISRMEAAVWGKKPWFRS